VDSTVPQTTSNASRFASTVPQQEQTLNTSGDAPAITDAPRPTVDLHQAQISDQRRQAEERQRAQAERERLIAAQESLEQKAAGQDVIIPLDQCTGVNVGGIPVSVKIHDNDVTSFDVWINGGWRRAVPKQKGVTHSGTDETPIYASGRARLYYVWEPSGKLNHCLLRIRED
jgi:sulfite reductase beta subunit-like hemoprotein